MYGHRFRFIIKSVGCWLKDAIVVQPHFFNDDDGYTLEDTQDRKRREPMGYTSCVQCMDVNFDSSSQLVVGLNMLVVQPYRYQDDPVDKLFLAGYEMLPDVFDTLYLSSDYKPFNAVQPWVTRTIVVGSLLPRAKFVSRNCWSGYSRLCGLH